MDDFYSVKTFAREGWLLFAVDGLWLVAAKASDERRRVGGRVMIAAEGWGRVLTALQPWQRKQAVCCLRIVDNDE